MRHIPALCEAALQQAPISLDASQQLTQEECPRCVLARCVSMCLRVSETGPGPVISHRYCSSCSSAGRQGSYRLDPQVLMCVCVLSGQHLTHCPLMMSCIDQQASGVRFGVSVWREMMG